jgi:hypothetical protein
MMSRTNDRKNAEPRTLWTRGSRWFAAGFAELHDDGFRTVRLLEGSLSFGSFAAPGKMFL